MKKLIAVLMFTASMAGAVVPPQAPTKVKVPVKGGIVIEYVDANGNVISGQFMTLAQLQAQLAASQKATAVQQQDLQDSISKVQGQ